MNKFELWENGRKLELEADYVEIEPSGSLVFYVCANDGDLDLFDRIVYAVSKGNWEWVKRL